MSIAIINLQHKLSFSRAKIKHIVSQVLSKERACAKDICLMITTDRKIRRLNRAYLNKDFSTDVLAFELSSPGQKFHCWNLLGDIIVSADATFVNAKIYKTTPQRELYLYIIHGLLHLLGYDDTSALKRAVMRRREQYYLKKIRV